MRDRQVRQLRRELQVLERAIRELKALKRLKAAPRTESARHKSVRVLSPGATCKSPTRGKRRAGNRVLAKILHFPLTGRVDSPVISSVNIVEVKNA